MQRNGAASRPETSVAPQRGMPYADIAKEASDVRAKFLELLAKPK